MDPNLILFLTEVTASCPGLKSIWLFGSRANGTATATSDWDLIAFGNETTLKYLHAAQHLHNPSIDFFVVANGDDLRAPWGADDKLLSLSELSWDEVSDGLAEYVQSKAGSEPDSSATLKKVRAIRVWPTEAVNT